MIAWIKRYSNISLDEINSMTPAQFEIYCNRLNEILVQESGGNS